MPKNVIVLSDGTGNAAASIWRTNVWRIFQAIDLTGSDQVARYDDGIGTSSFKAFAIISGAFGWGLKRNVLDLYKFICRNYGKDSKIYGFGFSRGAFTIRVLIGLIADQGLIPFTNAGRSGCEGARCLSGVSPCPLSQFRSRRLPSGSRHFCFHQKQDAAPGSLRSPQRTTGMSPSASWACGTPWRPIGLPVEEWTIGIDRYLWPLELPNRTPWRRIERACHA